MARQHIEVFNKLKSNYTNLLELVSTLNVNQLNKNTEADKWSCGQIMEHLQMSFGFTILYLNKKITQPELIPVAGFKSTLRYWLIKFVLISPIKIKAPKGVDNVPEVTTIEHIQQGVKKNLQALEEFINRYPVELNQKAIFKHPLAGRINLYQTIQFLNDHLMHHDRQIRQIISKLH